MVNLHHHLFKHSALTALTLSEKIPIFSLDYVLQGKNISSLLLSKRQQI